MTQLEILELALIGAKVKLQNAARYFCTVSIGDKLYNNLKSAIQDYDEIMGLIEKEKSLDCSHQPRQEIEINVLLEGKPISEYSNRQAPADMLPDNTQESQ